MPAEPAARGPEPTRRRPADGPAANPAKDSAGELPAPAAPDRPARYPASDGARLEAELLLDDPAAEPADGSDAKAPQPSPPKSQVS